MATILSSLTGRNRLPTLRSSLSFNFLPRTILTSSSSARVPLRMDEQQAHGQHSASKDQWKKRAPYRIHEPNDKFNALYEANCHCGQVKYQLSRQEPLDSKLCHCTTCQTQHGR